MFNNDYGLINNMLAKIGLDGPAWLTDPSIVYFYFSNGIRINFIKYMASNSNSNFKFSKNGRVR
ncbi:hypothetical protein EfmAA242_31420 (plasmid) [Enterococcus faecium]|nr:hypothetical protein EfmAA242_31420 [Enterococcus faecium]